jgi:hypothetical protein
MSKSESAKGRTFTLNCSTVTNLGWRVCKPSAESAQAWTLLPRRVFKGITGSLLMGIYLAGLAGG